MNRKNVCLILVILLLSGCGLMSKDKKVQPPPPPPPEPTRIVLEIEAAGDINPDPEGRSSPLVLRIFQLKSKAAFNGADFFSLYEKDESVLGGDLIRKEEVTLKPNERRTLKFEAHQDTRTIGVFGTFRNYEEAIWRAAAAVQPNTVNLLNVYVSGTTINIR